MAEGDCFEGTDGLGVADAFETGFGVDFGVDLATEGVLSAWCFGSLIFLPPVVPLVLGFGVVISFSGGGRAGGGKGFGWTSKVHLNFNKP